MPRRAADWWTKNADEHGAENVLVITRRGSAAAALNQHIRTARLLAGQLGPDAVTAAGATTPSATASSHAATTVRLGLDNGTRGTVTRSRSAHGSPSPFAPTIERTLTIPAEYLAAGHVQHAYAQTAHLTQGSTAETALIVTTPDEHSVRMDVHGSQSCPRPDAPPRARPRTRPAAGARETVAPYQQTPRSQRSWITWLATKAN